MTDDLVTRLRKWAFKFCGKGEQEDLASDAMSEAADRIKELEGALCQIWVLNQRGDKFKDEIDMVVSTAMDGKTDD